MKKNDLLVMLVIYVITSVVMYIRVGVSFQFFMYLILFPIVFMIFASIMNIIKKK
ncbi:Uncharacterised protein [Staphylococcus chromogenes]|nr:hypothetical protein GCM10008139_15000 [Staphylococcus chromogenes]SUM11604.1 Uncharacterised protein [Staphylococcus chromogenes]